MSDVVKLIINGEIKEFEDRKLQDFVFGTPSPAYVNNERDAFHIKCPWERR